MNQTHVHAVVVCPYCGHVMDHSTNLTGAGVPGDGDWSLCIRCGGVCVVHDGQLRKPTNLEANELEASPLHPVIVRAQAFIRSRGPE